jgi:hypothetical protein
MQIELKLNIFLEDSTQFLKYEIMILGEEFRAILWLQVNGFLNFQQEYNLFV